MLEDRILNYNRIYEKATIYKISVNDKIYYGSTKNYYFRRHNHISKIKNKWNSGKLYKYIFDNNCNLEDIKFDIIKEISNVSKNEVDILEDELINSVDKNLSLNQRKSCIMISRRVYHKNWNNKVICNTCGSNILKSSYSNHYKSSKHLTSIV